MHVRVTAARLMAVLGFLAVAPEISAYSVLTHEAIVDAAWDESIKPLLRKRFPSSTPDQLKEAHAYAYGGSIIQDMGYYPFGSKLFTDLLHYVRSGDFILNLIRESRDLNEYAFALGALAHYAGDDNGHRIAVNVSVPLLYPKLRAKFGDRVTYADNPATHLKTEFSFDVLQVAQGHYAPDSYHSFIGFEVARPVLERAFQDTYGFPLANLFASEDLAIGTYRFSVSSAIPGLTKAAWATKKDEIARVTPGITRKRFLYNLSHASYRKDWGSSYKEPGPGARFLAFLIRILPKIGPLKTLRFRTPTPQAEKLFMASFDATLAEYRRLLAAQEAGHPDLPNDNFDTGEPVKAGAYRLADNAYAELLDKLRGRYQNVPPDLRTNILAFYSDLSAPIATKANAKKWAHLQNELDELKRSGLRSEEQPQSGRSAAW